MTLTTTNWSAFASTAVVLTRSRTREVTEPTSGSALLGSAHSSLVKVVSRALRYPRNWPHEKAEEKGIDVALAIDVVAMAVRNEFDIGVVMSTDTDIKPALEAVSSIGGNPFPRVAVATWSASVGHSRRLSIPGRQLWCYWLNRQAYGLVADATNYVQD